MENNDSQSIQDNLDNRINELIKKDEKENNINYKLIYCIAIVSFLFIGVGTFLSYKNYKKIQQTTSNEQKVVRVVVKEY